MSLYFNVFYAELARLKINLTLYCFYTTVINNGVLEPYLLLTNSLFTLLLSESQEKFNLFKFIMILKQKFESQVNVINQCSILW